MVSWLLRRRRAAIAVQIPCERALERAFVVMPGFHPGVPCAEGEHDRTLVRSRVLACLRQHPEHLGHAVPSLRTRHLSPVVAVDGGRCPPSSAGSTVDLMIRWEIPVLM